MLWQLLAKALISGVVIAAASEVARRSPGWGGLIASLPLTTLLAMIWLWRDTHDGARVADLALSTAFYVAAALPAFVVAWWLLRRGADLPWALVAAAAVAFAGYLAVGAAGRKFGLPL